MIDNKQTSVLMIGCGPAGMSFLHAVAMRRQKLENDGDLEGLSYLPLVSCFERASSPGGVWRAASTKDGRLYGSDDDTISCCDEEMSSSSSSSSSDDEDDRVDDDENIMSSSEKNLKVEAMPNDAKSSRTSSINKCPQMYDALWTNGYKELIEFPDYTYDEHFKHPLPAYMPRQLILEYMMARVTKNNPDFFGQVQFNTSVSYVSYDEGKKKFEVLIDDHNTGQKSTIYFDKCIWGGGLNGKSSIPKSIQNLLQKKSFVGETVHSSNAGAILGHLQGKNILMIGASYSAEDLALQAVKQGCDKVYILSRSGDGPCNEIGAWPMGKVHMINEFSIIDVTNEGRSILLKKSEYDNYEDKVTVLPDGETMEIENIHIVVYCTGYKRNFGMLNPSLYAGYSDFDENGYCELPENWKMSKNCITDDIDEVVPSECLASDWVGVWNGIYRGLLISNPNMMFLHEGGADIPMFEIDVHAHLLLAYIMGDIEIPTEEGMRQYCKDKVSRAMMIPGLRYYMDLNYMSAICELGEEDEKHFTTNSEDPMYETFWSPFNRFIVEELARDMKDANYLCQYSNEDGTLNEKGELATKLHWYSAKNRKDLSSDDSNSEWMTFRDWVPHPDHVSLHTGTPAVPLKGRWMDLDDHDPNLVVL